MRKQVLIIVLFTILCIDINSQIIFKNGYFIDESNKRNECLIKNIDWRDNPTEFEYKLSQNDTVRKGTIQNVKEFGIYNICKYIRAKTEIDRSSNHIDKMSKEINPSFKEELLFLKVLIEGEASLFLYNDGSLTRLFYKLDNSEIKQLVYKKFILDGNISENSYFKQQLLLELKCEEIKLKEIEQLRYSKRDLEKIFIKYNESVNAYFINYKPKQKIDYFNLNIRPGLNYGSLEIPNPIYNTNDIDFENNISIRFGIETEFVFPSDKDKWGISVEPTYQYYKSEQRQGIRGGYSVRKVKYKSIELPICFRHYFYLNDNSKIFANIAYVIDFAYNSEITFSVEGYADSYSQIIKPRKNIAMGIGYKFLDRYGIELRYYTYENFISNYWDFNSDHRTISIVIGYTLF